MGEEWVVKPGEEFKKGVILRNKLKDEFSNVPHFDTLFTIALSYIIFSKTENFDNQTPKEYVETFFSHLYPVCVKIILEMQQLEIGES
jgi:hypothetical protein